MAKLKNGKILNGWCVVRHQKGTIPERYIYAASTNQPWRNKSGASYVARRWMRQGYDVTVMKVNYFYEPDPEE